MSQNECLNSIIKLKTICKRLGVPIAEEKTEGPVKSMEYLGLTIGTVYMSVKVPEEKNERNLES